MKIRLVHADKLVIAEFVLIILATLFFLWGVFDYHYNYKLSPPIWGFFAFFMLAKSWLEFYETHEDRRTHELTDEELKELPFTLRRQTD